MLGLNNCGRDLLELRRETGGTGNTGGMLVGSGRWDWKLGRAGRVPGGDRGREEGKNKTGFESKVSEHWRKSFTTRNRQKVRLHNTAVLPLEWLERFCEECRIWWVLVGSR